MRASYQRELDVVVAEAQVRFLAPARFDDQLTLEIAVARTDSQQGTLVHTFVRDLTTRREAEVARSMSLPRNCEDYGSGDGSPVQITVTERPGRMRIVAKDGALSPALAGVPKVFASGQGGLLDVLLAPDFAKSGIIYFSYGEPREDGKNGTTAARARLVLGGA